MKKGDRVRIMVGYRSGWEGFIAEESPPDHRARHSYFRLRWADKRPSDKRGREREPGWYRDDEIEPISTPRAALEAASQETLTAAPMDLGGMVDDDAVAREIDRRAASQETT